MGAGVGWGEFAKTEAGEAMRLDPISQAQLCSARGMAAVKIPQATSEGRGRAESQQLLCGNCLTHNSSQRSPRRPRAGPETAPGLVHFVICSVSQYQGSRVSHGTRACWDREMVPHLPLLSESLLLEEKACT